MDEVIKLTGTNSSVGPISAIFAGVHGNETCGPDAFKAILPNLKITNGTVYFILANPAAIAVMERFTEMDLNRVFKPNNEYSDEQKKSYEFKRGQCLKEILKDVDVLLDIHSSMTEKSIPFIICEKNANEIVKFLPAKIVANGFDSIEPGGTDYYMNRIGKIGICIECGFHKEPSSVEIAIKAINTFLSVRGHIDNIEKIEITDQKKIEMYKLYKTKTPLFELSKFFADFELVKNGTIIGTDGSQEVSAGEDSIILFARNKNQINAEGFLLGRVIL